MPVDTTASMLRQLKLLVMVLIISNVALGAYGFYLLRTIDRNYSALIDQSVPILNRLQTLTAGASDAMRSTNPDLLTEDKLEPAVGRAAKREPRSHRRSGRSEAWL